MKQVISIALTALIANVASAKALHDYDSPKDMSVQCSEAVVNKLVKDKGTGQYFEDVENYVSLEWYDEEKTQVSFTLNFGEDVRDGYLTGEVAVKLKPNGTCTVGKIVNWDIGD